VDLDGKQRLICLHPKYRKEAHMVDLTKSVGKNGVNSSADVEKVQTLLNANLHLLPAVKKLTVDKRVGALTIRAIEEYQKNVLKMAAPDGRVDPGGRTLQSLEKTARKPRPANVTAFVVKTLADAKSIKAKYRIPVSIVMAQAALESGWGLHVKGNAYFGVKAHNTSGQTTSFKTTEFVNGKNVSIADSFRSYATFKEAAEDYGKFLTSNIRYKAAFLHANDPYKFAEHLQIAGYATDPRYADKLKAVISTYYLDEYDK
jgi:type VI secretion system secreted protein VgrG